MFSLNVNNEDVFLKDVKLNKLVKIHKWYNNIDEYGFATGVDRPMPFDYILKSILKWYHPRKNFLWECIIFLMKWWVY